MRDEVLNGRGFLLMRGLPVERWSMREAATAYFGLGAHLGSARSQNAKGHVLGHVQDLGLDAHDPNVRIYQTSARQTFHTNSCDIVALLCLKTARSGGLSALVSSTTIFNEMRRRRPDLLALLFEPIATDRRGEVADGAEALFRDSGVQLARGAPDRDLSAPVHQLGAAFRRRAAPDAGASSKRSTCSMRWPTIPL